MELPHALHRATPGRAQGAHRGRAARSAVSALPRRRRGAAHPRPRRRARAPDDRAQHDRTTSRCAGIAEVSRVHASLEQLGDEWTFVEDGALAQRLVHRRRARARAACGCATATRSALGRTVIVFRSPTGRESLRTATSQRATAPKVSEAQLRVLTALCRPYAEARYAVPASNKPDRRRAHHRRRDGQDAHARAVRRLRARRAAPAPEARGARPAGAARRGSSRSSGFAVRAQQRRRDAYGARLRTRRLVRARRASAASSAARWLRGALAPVGRGEVAC